MSPPVAAQTKRQTGIHETHHQINNMPKLTPQELSRKKEYSDLVLRRQAEEVRNRQLREQQARLQGAAGVRNLTSSLFAYFPYGPPRLPLLTAPPSNSPTGLDRPCHKSEVK